MKLFLKILFLLVLPPLMNAQTRLQIDSAYLILQHASNDTVRMGAYSMLGGLYDDINADSGMYYCSKGIAIAERLDFQLNKAEMMAFMGWPLMKTGNYPEALRVISQGLEIAEDPSNEKNSWILQKGQTPQMYRRSVIGLLYAALEYLYLYVGNYEKQILIAHEAITRLESAGDTLNLAGLYPDIGDSYLKLNKFDSALFYQQKSLFYYSKIPFHARKFEGSTYTSIGNIYEKMGNSENARENYKKAILISEQHDNPRLTGNACLQLAILYQSEKKSDSSFHYAKKALEAFTRGGYKKEVAMAYRMISDFYHAQNNTDTSFAYLRLATILDDSLDKIETTKLQEFQVAAFNKQLELQQQEQERIEKEGNLKTIAILTLIAVFGTIGLLLYRNNRQKQKANQILKEKNNQIEQTLSDLKATQKQLVQSEKMASLGELTAGIAHEIQNPLNFVNNFSEVNSELIKELKNEAIKVNLAEVIDLSDEIDNNSEKITHHGKRADGIVKSMLQHSRSSEQSGKLKKEPTDINALADEYLRLAYHGLRAKDQSFNAILKTDFDPGIGLIQVIPQDIARAILNLITNAFYAVQEKGKKMQLRGESFSPTVSISTKRMGAKVEIRVKDNGSGIPPHVLDKIFQPFFTTKPPGLGTGLGLSLAYDITKAHDGTLTASSKEREGTEFVLQLPFKTTQI